MMRLYEMPDSGNCYKVRLILTQLGQDFERIHTDILKKESRTADFLKKNPNGRVPLLEIEENVFLPESNAILWYLAEGSQFVPEDRLGRAQVLQWMFFEQYSHEPYIATSRFWITLLNAEEEYKEEIEKRKAQGYAALDVMESHLSHQEFFVGNRYSIADIALYAYTHVAHEGRFDLTGFPQIKKWLKRIQGQANHIKIDD
ncbi:MAG: glutathione S-transferase family protein [SAR324 cluster bacterium]|nr:glutathione S-transferase family protein [SAR324 cluster bacterium]